MSALKESIILVVDDDREYRDIHRRRLEGKVGKLHIVENRLAATDLIRRQFFHAAVLDIRLVDLETENVEGLELARTIFERGESTGIVIVSGYGTTDRARVAFRQYRVVDFLEKATYTPEQFIRAIEDAVTSAAGFVEEVRNEVSPERLIRPTTLDEVKKNLDFTQQRSFDQVLQYLVRPLAPLAMSAQFERISDDILEIRCWSRFQGYAYAIRIGPRARIKQQVELYRQSGLHEDKLYTMSSISGFRYVEGELSPESFS